MSRFLFQKQSKIQSHVALGRKLQSLKHKKLYLLGFILIALVWAINMSVTPYLLKIIIDTVVQYAGNHQALLAKILIPIAAYILMTILLNLNFRLYDYINLKLYP